MSSMFRVVLMIPLIITIVSQFITPVHGEDISDNPKLEVQSEAGFLDLHHVDMTDGNQVAPLHGEWEFYWKQLLEPGDLPLANQEITYIQVPSSWGDQPLNSEAQAKFGYGTYRIVVQIPSDDIGKSKAIYLKSIGSAYRIWVDGEEQSGLGVVGTSIEEETPQIQINLIFVEPKQEMMEVVIQVSNFSFREGGMTSEIVYGDTKEFIVHLMKEMFYDIFIIGGFFLISLFHLIIYGFRKKDIQTLLIGLLFFAVTLRTLFLNEYLTSLILGIHSWEFLVKLEYIVENIAFLMVILLMKVMYPQETHRYMVYISYLSAAVLSLFVFITPARIFTDTMLLQTSVKAVILLYFVFYIGVVAFARRREGALINLVAVSVAIIAIVNDMLYYTRLVNTVELFNYGAVIFLLSQAVIVSYRYTRISSRNDALVVELGYMNATLEYKVEVRTKKLNDLNEQLSEMKALRTKMLVNIAHDLNSPLTGVQTYLHLMDRGIFPVNQQDITKQLIEKTNYIQRLIRDLFDLSKLETKEQSFDFEQVQAQEWLADVHNQFAGELEQVNCILQQGRRETIHNDREVYILIDRFRMMQVMQNYVDNAVKFSQGKSNVITISAYIRAQSVGAPSELVVEVIDSGEGIATEQLPHLFNRFYKKRVGNEGGSGLGLAIVAEIIEQHQGKVGVKSELGLGSTFFFTLPIAQDIN